MYINSNIIPFKKVVVLYTNTVFKAFNIVTRETIIMLIIIKLSYSLSYVYKRS